ncbi:SDR family NAD(P)-dependent oxidoreductase [Hyphomonas atlantica corrig.]|uniref:SDR family NAD(P)-dependent oxidoreductase n=1 Tax=Hyphomonas atlantica TaxID=1280948 RepID=UPI0023555573|nr:SDR family NAD(P)-dependent oxidoreductase [Hyphomonas atlantica]
MNAIVFGSNGGIGRALTEQLVHRGQHDTVFGVSRTGTAPDGALGVTADALEEGSLRTALKEIAGAGDIRLCIVAIGLLHAGEGLQPEKSHRHQSRDAFEKIFAANTIAPALIAKHVLGEMPRSGRWVFAPLSARVGSISDNRLGGWHAYRASKAALNMLIRNYAIESARKNDESICVGLHPGTVDTGLSEPFQSNVPDTQLFSPEQCASYLLDVIEGLRAGDSGHVFDWAGKRIEP